MSPDIKRLRWKESIIGFITCRLLDYFTCRWHRRGGVPEWKGYFERSNCWRCWVPVLPLPKGPPGETTCGKRVYKIIKYIFNLNYGENKPKKKQIMLSVKRSLSVPSEFESPAKVSKKVNVSFLKYAYETNKDFDVDVSNQNGDWKVNVTSVGTTYGYRLMSIFRVDVFYTHQYNIIVFTNK